MNYSMIQLLKLYKL